MIFDEAMSLARAGKKVTTQYGDMLYVYHLKDVGYRVVRYSLAYGSHNYDYVPEPYDKMRNWVVYKEEKLLQRIVKFFTRANRKSLFGFSSDPA